MLRVIAIIVLCSFLTAVSGGADALARENGDCLKAEQSLACLNDLIAEGAVSPTVDNQKTCLGAYLVSKIDLQTGVIEEEQVLAEQHTFYGGVPEPGKRPPRS